MKTQLMGLALAATTIGVLTACSAPGTQKLVSQDAGRPAAPRSTTSTSATASPVTASPMTTHSSTSVKKKNTAKIVYFKLVQKPKCAEGTAVFRAKPVPAIIKWKITGARSAALSVDDATHTAGTYGPEPLSGTETFLFSCLGPVGSTEKHTYAIYTVGGGKQHSLTITAKARVLDDGIH